MRKKITALSLFLLAMIGFSANAVTYTWSIDGEVVQDGASLQSFSEVTLTVSDVTGTFDGGFGNVSDSGVYTSEGRYVSGFSSWSWYYADKVDDTTYKMNLPIQSDAVYPDYPMTSKGNYYVCIPEGVFIFDYKWNSETNQAEGERNPELRFNFSLDPVPGYVSKDNVTVAPEEGILKSLPEMWEVALNNEDLTSIEFVGTQKPMFYMNSGTNFELDVQIADNTIYLIPSQDLKDEFAELYDGDYRVIIYKDSFKFNGDDAKTNDLIQLWYTIPETVDWNKNMTYPLPAQTRYDWNTGENILVPSIVSSLGRIDLYFYEKGEVIINEEASDWSNVPYVAYLDEQFQQWIPLAFYEAEVIPSVEDEYGDMSYPGVRLSFKDDYAGMVFPEATYRVIVPGGAYTVNIPESRYGDPAKTLDSKLLSLEYQLKTRPEVSTTPVWGIEQGAELESFEGTTVAFAGLKNVALVDEYGVAAMLYRKNADGSETELGRMTTGVNDESTDWKTVITVDENGAFPVTMDENVFEPFFPLDIDGEYCIRMPFNVLKLEGFNDLVNEASELNFTINNNSLIKTEYCTIDPAPCEISAYPQKLTITIDNEAIETLELGTMKEFNYGWDDNGVYWEEEIDVPTKAGIIYNDSYQVGTYLIEINPENPMQLILTPDPSSISADAILQYGSYKFRIPRGGLIANKGTETESTCSILEFGNYDNIQRHVGEIYSPAADDEELTELYEFKIKYRDAHGNDAQGELRVGDATAVLYAFDAMTNDWVHYSDLVSEIVTDKTMGIEVAIVRLPYEPVFADGLYKVVVPRNTFYFDNYYDSVVGDAVEAEYVLNTGVKAYDLALNPAEGDVPYIDDITFTFNDWWMSSACVEWDENWNMRKENAAVAVDEEGNVLATATISTEYGENWAMYQKIDFEPAIRQEGVCKVIVGWNVFDTDYDGMGDSEGFMLNYNIIPGAPELVVTPADGETVKELVNFTLTWNGATEVVINPEMMVAAAKLYRVTEEGNVLQSDLICSPAGDKSVVLDIMNLSTEMPNGQYILDVPAGMFTANGYANEAFTATYELAAVIYNFEVLEAPFNKIKLTVENCEELKVREDCPDKATLWYMTGGESKVGEYAVTFAEGNVVEFTLAEAVEVMDGDYVMWLPEGYFWVGNDQSKDVKFAIEGVVSVETIGEDANFDIYSVNGMIIKRNGNKADLKALDPGVYVINGQKVLVK